MLYKLYSKLISAFCYYSNILSRFKLCSGFKFEERTRTACATIQNDLIKFISGHENKNKTIEECKFECEKYKWCRGIGVKKENSRFCRLLSNDSTPLDGWTYKNPGNWAEPKDWKETRIYESYQCLEKVEISTL